MKVGKTDVDGSVQAETVAAQILRAVGKDSELAEAKVDVAFHIPKGVADTSSSSDVEERVRRSIGRVLLPEKARAMNLPSHTEWVITPKNHLAAIQKQQKEEANFSASKLSPFTGALPKKPLTWGAQTIQECDVIPLLT